MHRAQKGSVPQLLFFYSNPGRDKQLHCGILLRDDGRGRPVLWYSKLLHVSVCGVLKMCLGEVGSEWKENKTSF